MIAHSTTRYDPQSALASEETRSRHAALASAVAAIRVRRARLAVEQILLIAAAVLFPLGLIFILLGWEGAAHNGHTYAQIDYLISGGIFGLGLSVAGGFMYFGYWLSRQLSESRRQNALTVQALQRLEDLLDFAVNARVAGEPFVGGGGAGRRLSGSGVTAAGGTAAGGTAAGGTAAGGTAARGTAAGGSAGGGAGGSTAARGGAGRGNGRRGGPGRTALEEAERPTGQVPALGDGPLFATPRGNLLHRAECPVVARRNDLKTVEPGTDGYGYCTMCNAEVPV